MRIDLDAQNYQNIVQARIAKEESKKIRASREMESVTQLNAPRVTESLSKRRGVSSFNVPSYNPNRRSNERPFSIPPPVAQDRRLEFPQMRVGLIKDASSEPYSTKKVDSIKVNLLRQLEEEKKNAQIAKIELENSRDELLRLQKQIYALEVQKLGLPSTSFIKDFHPKDMRMFNKKGFLGVYDQKEKHIEHLDGDSQYVPVGDQFQS